MADRWDGELRRLEFSLAWLTASEAAQACGIGAPLRWDRAVQWTREGAEIRLGSGVRCLYASGRAADG